jgi:hypothetical protein
MAEVVDTYESVRFVRLVLLVDVNRRPSVRD